MCSGCLLMNQGRVLHGPAGFIRVRESMLLVYMWQSPAASSSSLKCLSVAWDIHEGL